VRAFSFSLILCLSSICAGAFAQKPADASANPTAIAKWKALSDQQAERMKGLKRGDTEGRKAMMEARFTDLDAFAKEFDASVEANRARLEIAQIAMQNKDHAEAGKNAIAAFNPNQGELALTLQAANMAGRLELAEQQGKLLDTADARAKTIDERIELLTALKLGIKDEARYGKALAATEAMAKDDETKAALLLGKARLFRYENRKDTAGYQEALEAVVTQFPATKAGQKASSKIAAAKLAPGSDPVAFTTKDMDGKDVSVADYKGKVLLIDFWATWCGPCMAELPNVLEAYEAYHAQGFEILGISLDRDTDKDKLIATIKNEKMAWRHVYDGKFWSAEIAELHDVQSIPFTILIGKDGKVIATNLRGDKLGPAIKAALEAK